jgi:hypothetical protein
MNKYKNKLKLNITEGRVRVMCVAGFNEPKQI